MSSLIVGERRAEAEKTMTQGTAENSEQVGLSVDRRFSRNSRLRFVTYIYNAARGEDSKAPPDVALQVQVLRDAQPVLTTALRKVNAESGQDLARLPYAAEISLETMPAGRYVLQVTAIDRVAKTSVTRQVNFEIV